MLKYFKTALSPSVIDSALAQKLKRKFKKKNRGIKKINFYAKRNTLYSNISMWITIKNMSCFLPAAHPPLTGTDPRLALLVVHVRPRARGPVPVVHGLPAVGGVQAGPVPGAGTQPAGGGAGAPRRPAAPLRIWGNQKEEEGGGATGELVVPL